MEPTIDTYTPAHQEFEMMFFATKDRVHHFIAKFIKDPQQVKDVLQNVYLTAWQNFSTLTNKDNLLPLLYTYAKGFTTKEVAREAKRLQIEMALAPTGWHDETVHIEGRELERMVEKAIAALPARKQQVFRLKREENLSYAQIAERLNISPQTVANHMSEALEFLRGQLQKEQVALLTMVFLSQYAP